MMFPGVLHDMGKQISSEGWRPYILNVLCVKTVQHVHICRSLRRSDVSKSMMEFCNYPELLVILGVAQGPLTEQEMEVLETEIKLGKQWQTQDEFVVGDADDLKRQNEAKSGEKGEYDEGPVVDQVREIVERLKRQYEERAIREMQNEEILIRQTEMIKTMMQTILEIQNKMSSGSNVGGFDLIS